MAAAIEVRRISGRYFSISSVLHFGERIAVGLLICVVVSIACGGLNFHNAAFPRLAVFGPMALFAAVVRRRGADRGCRLGQGTW